MINGTIEADIHYVDMLRGKDGESAFQLAVDQGYTGTLDEWLASLKGEKGETGEQGAKGDKGDTGAQGIQGEKGEQGIQGIQGEKGDKGDQGERGIQGIQGIQGETGAKGDKGDTGEKGADGYTPVKGTDYFTDADKTELVASVKSEIEGRRIELIDTLTLKSDTTGILLNKSTNPDGSPYSFSEIIIEITSPISATSKNSLMYVYVYAGDSVLSCYTDVPDNTNFRKRGLICASVQAGLLQLYATGMGLIYDNEVTDAIIVYRNPRIIITTSNISSIQIKSELNVPSGTTFNIYGIKFER